MRERKEEKGRKKQAQITRRIIIIFKHKFKNINYGSKKRKWKSMKNIWKQEKYMEKQGMGCTQKACVNLMSMVIKSEKMCALSLK